MANSREAQLSELFVELADTLTSDFDLVDLLTRLASRLADMLPADEAGVILADQRGELHVMASSTERMRILELFEIQNDEGPCLDAFRTGQPLINVELDTADERWPQFAPAARERGFWLVHAFPMHLRGESVGVVNAFAADHAVLTAEEARVGQALADAATIGILQERATREARVVVEQLQHALTSRVLIEQAKGVLAEQTGRDVSQVFELIRRYARGTNTRIAEVAREIVERKLSVDDLTGTT